MNKAVRNTITIIIIIAASVGLGYVFSKVVKGIEEKMYPLKYKEYVEEYSEKYNVPREIIYGVIKAESGFDGAAESGAGAIGLMQITPDTFDWIANKLGETADERFLKDEETNIKYGTYYLSYLYKEFGSWDIAFAAYNAGPNRVKNNWLNNPEYINDNNEIVYIPIEETRNYIKRVNKNADAYKRLYFTK